MREQVETSSKRVTDLQATLKQKKDNYEKYTKESRESREAAKVEIENLIKAKRDLVSEKITSETKIKQKGEEIGEKEKQRHECEMAKLEA